MQQYQYKVISIVRNKTDEALERLGREGWELCGTTLEGEGEDATLHLFFKKLAE